MKLFKFASITPRSIISIATGKFFAATLEMMNDPFEDRFKAGSEHLARLVRGCGVICMSGSDDRASDVLTNPLMWAHYASNHTGIAIGLRPSTKIPGLTKVEYLTEEELASKIQWLRDESRKRTDGNIWPWIMEAFKYKPTFWSYENEYRRAVLGGNRYSDPAAEIDEVVFGFRSRPEDELAVWLARRDTIRYRKATNINGAISIENYVPTKHIKVDNEFYVNVDQIHTNISDVGELLPAEIPQVTFLTEK